jgi:hypothetical protein
MRNSLRAPIGCREASVMKGPLTRHNKPINQEPSLGIAGARPSQYHSPSPIVCMAAHSEGIIQTGIHGLKGYGNEIFYP